MDSSPRLEGRSEALRAARQHLTACFGRPIVATAFRGASRAEVVEVGVFDAPSALVFASAGAASLTSDDGVPREWALFVKPSTQAPHHAAVSELVARIASERPAVGRVVRAPLDLDAFSSMRAYVLYPAWPMREVERTFRRRDGVLVQLGWIVPVHLDEAEIARKESATALWRRFAEQNVDLLDLNRAPVTVE